MAVFGFNQIKAQNPLCPEFAFIVPLPTEELYVIFDPAPGPDCIDRPATITVDSGATTYTLDMPSCTDGTSRYVLTGGPGVVDPNSFIIAYTSATGTSNCDYTGGVLPIGDFEFLNATLKVFPNPLMRDNLLTVKFSTNVSAKIYMYDVTGKLVMIDEIDNANRKQINTATLTNGLYFLQMVTDSKATITRKVIIMK